MRDCKILGFALVVSFFACTGGSTGGPGASDANPVLADGADVPRALHLLLPGDTNACPSFANADTAFDVFQAGLLVDNAPVLGVAEAKVVEECSGAGGAHVFSSRTADGKRFWLGNHACMLSVEQGALESGAIVGLGSQTAGLRVGEEGWCMNYPGESQVFSTDVDTSAIAWFASEAEAGAFVDALLPMDGSR